MTEKLFWDRPYDTTFDAKIIEIESDGIILDRTLFYPEGGNQISDKGVINRGGKKFKVDHVSKKGDLIVHHISEPFGGILKKDQVIEGEIDWEYRYGVMRAHSSQHILSAVFKNLYGIDTIRANISFENVSIHINRSVKREELDIVLQTFLKICTVQGLQFRSKLISREEIPPDKIRGEMTTDTNLRIIEIEDYDINCCGGTHIASSSEIGPIYFYEIKKGSEFKYYVGEKAIEAISRDNLEILDFATRLNSSSSEVLKKIKTQFFDLKEEKNKLILENLELISNSPTMILEDVKIAIIDYEVDYKTLAKANYF